MQKGLVSIITPCYNTGSIVHRLLDSILEQDYPSVEMFAIDDGSTDNTPDIIKSYIPKFEKRGYRLTYVKQENGGQSSAINNGLKMVSGEYLAWPDSDDFYCVPTAISSLVITLNENKEVAVARALPINVSEVSLQVISKRKITDEIMNGEQFENCLYSNHMIWPPVNYMIRMEAFEKVNPLREIYVEKNAGQNWQMLLPILYEYKCKTINTYLSNVLVRPSSHSRGQYKTYEQQVLKFDSYKNTILNTLDRIQAMPPNKREEYKRIIRNKYKFNQLELAISFRKKDDISKLKAELLQEGIIFEKKRELFIKLRRYKVVRLLLGVISKLKI